MAWKLKDKNLEAELNKLSNGEFSKRLNELKPCAVMSVSLTVNGGKIAVFLEGKDVEQHPDYKPNDWNKYPAVIPPEGVLMRVEAVGRSGAFRDCAIFKDGVWQSEMDGEACGEFYAKVKRFRPWGD